MSGVLQDSHGRVMRDLRVSITDRCNFRCLYCLPETEEAANFYQTRFTARSPAPSTPIQYGWKSLSFNAAAGERYPANMMAALSR